VTEPVMLPPKDRVNEIDLMRFFAAMSVVLFHYAFRGYAADGYSSMPYPLLAPVAKYGYLGVELFFMVSGFVILMTASSGSLKKFIVSRVTRLYPAFWVSCTITFLAILTFGGQRFHASVSQYLVNMTLLSEFVRVPAIDGVYWSLFVELKFYALVALVLVAGRIHQVQHLLFVWLLLALFQEIYPIGVLHNLLVTDYAAYFVAGAITYLVWSNGLSLARIGIFVASWLLAVYQAVGDIPGFERYYHASLNSYAVTGIISAYFLIVFLVSVRKSGWFARRQWIMAGALTYPLYLIHQRVGYILIDAAYRVFNPHVVLWGTVAIMLLAAYSIHRLIERRTAPWLRQFLIAASDTGANLVAQGIGKFRAAR
jgi:peptidoglycan/LPS O-acetylase OafA/YrhL